MNSICYHIVTLLCAILFIIKLPFIILILLFIILTPLYAVFLIIILIFPFIILILSFIILILLYAIFLFILPCVIIKLLFIKFLNILLLNIIILLLLLNQFYQKNFHQQVPLFQIKKTKKKMKNHKDLKDVIIKEKVFKLIIQIILSYQIQ